MGAGTDHYYEPLNTPSLTNEVDPGTREREYFKKHMSQFRFRCREALIPYTENQSALINHWQRKFRTPWRDRYFAYTALLGSHMFYVLALPIPRWLGYGCVTRDLVFILGYSIYVSGVFKDYLCLPRPLAPPCHRIALSEYTTKEYGAPSSHSANATGVTLLLLHYVWASRNEQGRNMLILQALAALGYYCTLTLGRIYCGMHGILDLATGALIGALCFTVRIITRDYLNYDKVTSAYGCWYPVAVTALGLLMLTYHPLPIEKCPCFADSVAFIGVIAGIECSEWAFPRLFALTSHQYLAFELRAAGLAGCLLRILLGVLLVVLWKSLISKRLIYPTLLTFMHDDRPVSPNDSHTQPKISTTDTVGRFFIYFGIPVTVVLVCPYAFSLANL